MMTSEQKRTQLIEDTRLEVFHAYIRAKNHHAMLVEAGHKLEAERMAAIIHLLDQARRL